MLLRGCSVVGIRSGPKSVNSIYRGTWGGKLVSSPDILAKPTVRQADGAAGARCLIKRTPFCSGEDTELSPARKGAEFWQVLNRERISKNLCMGEGE